MNLKLKLFLFVFLISSAEANALPFRDVPIEIGTTIFKSVSSSIYIEYDRNYFSTIYREENKTFDDLLIPFKVKADKSVIGLYQMKLKASNHICDKKNIDVEVFIDDNIAQKDVGVGTFDFVNSDINSQWTEHDMKFVFPEIAPDFEQQMCQGMVALYIELVI